VRNQPKEAKNKSSVIQEHTCVTACAPEIDARDGVGEVVTKRVRGAELCSELGMYMK
jgi:hypothetical protein